MSDEPQLIARAVRGEVGALDALAATHRPTVVRTATHLLGDAEEAEDVAQDAFIRLQSALPGFRGDAELGTWLYRVTLNLCRDRMRRRKRRAEVPLARAPSENTTSSADPQSTTERRIAKEAVRAAIARLPEDQREAITLRFISDLPYSEIARITGAPQGTIASRVFRALRKLGTELEPTYLEIIR